MLDMCRLTLSSEVAKNSACRLWLIHTLPFQTKKSDRVLAAPAGLDQNPIKKILPIIV
jgi:hypothetical protein